MITQDKNIHYFLGLFLYYSASAMWLKAYLSYEKLYYLP